ncbi:MAG: endolytic transglycosylase MltG [Alphaproteobacteria bacterium]|nr:MAG: endolytic transglycosylase MltG [Alphaproteobacteria bacterium]
MNRKNVIGISIAIALAIILGTGIGLSFWGIGQWNNAGPLQNSKIIIIPPGKGLSAISRQLEQEAAIGNRFVFMAGTFLQGAEKKLKPGEYEFGAYDSSSRIMQKIASGKTVQHRYTVIEGAMIADVLAQIAAMPNLTGDIKFRPNEGDILPETYTYAYGDTRQGLIDQMTAAMQNLQKQIWDGRLADLPLRDWHDAITLASIVEAETPIDAERPRVAAVYINRLRIGMALQADPTVEYAMILLGKNLSKGLTYDHLKTAHPYNTYMVTGLPPGPIGNPGRKSIEAVLHPLETKELYFVADGKGGHVFSQTLAEHERNVKNWRKINR